MSPADRPVDDDPRDTAGEYVLGTLSDDEASVLEAGMVLTLEPGIAVGDQILVTEEDIVITETGAEWLTRPAPATLTEI